jgi:hypothetical protein
LVFFWLIDIDVLLLSRFACRLAGIPHSCGNSEFWKNPELQSYP